MGVLQEEEINTNRISESDTKSRADAGISNDVSVDEVKNRGV